jgi:hypothetical protein
VDEDEVTGEKASQDEVEVEGGGFESGEEEGESDEGKEDSGEEGGAVLVVEVVAGFKILFVGGWGVVGSDAH